MKTLIRPALSLFVLLSVVTGVVYPLVVTGVAQHEQRKGGTEDVYKRQMCTRSKRSSCISRRKRG